MAGSTWMGAGLASLVALAAVLGFAEEPLARLLGEEIPRGLLATVVGTAAALFGLLLGWLVPAERLLGPLRAPAERGFRFAGGFDGLVARPALALARAADAFDSTVHAVVLAVGRLGLAVAGAARIIDDRGIDGLIAALVRGTRGLGGRARALQSGLVHRELLLAGAGAAVILAFLAFGALGL